MKPQLLLYSINAPERRVISTLLETMNLNVIQANEYSEVGKALVEESPRIILIDILNSGAKVFRAIKSDFAYSLIPVLLFNVNRISNLVNEDESVYIYQEFSSSYENIMKTISKLIYKEDRIG